MGKMSMEKIDLLHSVKGRSLSTKKFEELESLRAKYKRYKEMRRLLGKEDKIVMDIKEMKDNFKVFLGEAW